MPDFSSWEWAQVLHPALVRRILQVVVLVVVGYPFVLFLASVGGKIARKRFSDQSAMLVRKAIFYSGMVLLLITVLGQLEFKLTALLGAAGIAGVALGFASQTSVSNIISGLFLISEKPFAVGDVIKVGDTMGTVLSIDLLSVKVRAFDNRFIRIPNENLIKTEVVNITRFPIRRLDINVGVAYKEDVARVKTVLKEIATQNPYCLDEPEPVIIFSNFGDSALEFLFGVWCVKTDFLALKNSIMQEIKDRFDAEGIEIPFPHQTFYTGAVTDPLPIRLVGDQSETNAPGETVPAHAEDRGE
jgi:small-conductance mechanosensitive channel